MVLVRKSSTYNVLPPTCQCSGNTVLATLPIGMLAQQVFTLTFPHAVAVIIGFGIMCAPFTILHLESLTIFVSGSATVGFIATLGPRFGMRTMVITRYAFGYWGGALISLLNILTQVGLQYSFFLAGLFTDARDRQLFCFHR